MKRKLLSFLFLLTLLGNNKVIAQCDCGDGSDGAFSATTNVTLPSGTYNYTTFYIESGMTVNVTGNQPLIINCTGKILIDGLLTVSGADGSSGVTGSNGGAGGIGVAGGHNGADGVYDVAGPVPGVTGNGPGAGNPGLLLGGGSGGGYGIVGYNGEPYMSGPTALGGAMYGDIYLVNYDGGSGGASGSAGNSCGSGGGGAGGGILIMRTCDSLVVTGSGVVSANGGNGGWDGGGDCGSGGGGAGGTLWLIAKTLVNDGNLQAFGGIGGFSANSPSGDGGQGGVGRIRLDHDLSVSSGNTSPNPGFTTLILKGLMSITGVTCNGDIDGSATVTGSGGGGFYNYLWVGGTSDNDTANLAPGSYIVTITDTNGCSVDDTAVITQPFALGSTISSTVETTVSSNDGTATVTVSGGTLPYTYLWSPGGGITNPLTGLDTGTYIVTITDDNGCTMMDTVHVGQGPVSVTTTIADHGLSIYPNPVSDVVTIVFKDKVSGEVMIQLTDNLGRVIVSEKYTNTSVFRLNTNAYASGNYMLRISAEGSMKNIPLSIVR
jgi:hypothetical protein